MKIEPELRAWLLRGDPARPDPGGVNKARREARLRKLEALDEADLARLLGDLRVLGGPGSGNFGHAGRPGEVGGSATGSVSAVLGALPPAVRDEVTVKIDARPTQAEASEKIHEYLLTHYNVQLDGPAKSMVDRDAGIAITSREQEAIAGAISHSFGRRIDSDDWKKVVPDASLEQRTRTFEAAFDTLLRLTNPLEATIMLDHATSELAQTTFKKWGWQ